MNMIKIWMAFFLLSAGLTIKAQSPQWHHRYDQALVMKMVCAIPDGKGGSTILARFDEVLEVLRETDLLTAEAPKILYLVGWQYNGHDDKYPAFFEVNQYLKRPEDSDARQSLLWLMEAAKKYHTTISLHINMTDAYEDSPLWQEYIAQDLLSKNEDGSLLVIGQYNGRKAYQVNYQREWEKGFAQRRIDRLIELLPPLREAGTIHLDAWIARDSKGHRESAIQEASFQQQVGRYWRSKGIDPTSEWVMDYMQGIIPFYWHFNSRTTEQYLAQPATLVTGGHFNPDLKSSDFGLEFLFGTSLYGEDKFPGWRKYRDDKFDGNWQTAFLRDFYLNFPQYAFLNQLQRMAVEGTGTTRVAKFSSEVIASLKDSTVQKGATVFRNHNTICFPLTWRKDRSYAAYSTNNTHLDFAFPEDIKANSPVTVFSLSNTGWKKERVIRLNNSRIQLALEAGKPLLLTPDNGNHGDTTFIHHVAVKKIPQKHAYHQTLTYKLLLAESGFDGPLKRRDNGRNIVHLNAEQTLQVIAGVDNLTLGIPKILYLVGWQYNGHDSKYPAFFEGNPAFKRAQDTDALESIRWIMREAKQYHTTVSLHINLFDAYEDSPLWETYVRNNIIARRKDGSLLGGEWGYPISYTQEWNTGFLQKRIDSLCALLPIQEAGTIHIDAFHTWPPLPVQQPDGSWKVNLEQKPISPFLPFTPADETATQEKIYAYFAAKGIDLTSEGADFLRLQAFEQYQSMAWWYGGLENYLKWPASIYSGGEDRSEWGKLFGTSMHIEPQAKNDPETLKGIKGEFSLKTLIWYYLNQHDRQYLVNSPDSKSVQFSGGLRTELKAGKLRLTENNSVLVDGDDLVVPATWLEGKNLVAYSAKGYASRTWQLPDAYRKFRKARLYRVTLQGKEPLPTTEIKNGKISLSLAADEMVLIQLQ